MGIKRKCEDKILQMSGDMDAQARAKYLAMIMKEEGCDYETALAMATGKSDPPVPEYSLGWKMCRPVWVVAFKTSKKNYRRFLDQTELTDAEREIFINQVCPLNLKKMFNDEMKEQKRV